jgi:hypothetical protein
MCFVWICPHSAFMCFVWFSEQTAIISLYCINWLVVITGTECVYCAVRTGPITMNIRFGLYTGHIMAQADSHRPPIVEARAHFSTYPWEICGDHVVLGLAFFPEHFCSPCQCHYNSVPYSLLSIC